MSIPASTELGGGLPSTRGYQQEMLEESLNNNLIIALDTGSGKTHIAVLRMKFAAENEAKKVSWFIAPTVALCEQQSSVISQALPVSVGLVSGALEPNQWKDPALWRGVLEKHRIMVTTPQVLLDALRHGYVHLGQDIGLIVFDEAHHATDNHPYNSIMKEFYFKLPNRHDTDGDSFRPVVLGLTASPIYGGHVESAFRTIEANLDSVIRAPRRHLEELATFVHRPVFKHIQYQTPSYDYPSRNVAALKSVIDSMHIENDPWVQSLREQLANLPPSPDRTRIDQKLSKAISKGNTYTHKGLNDFYRAASEICADVGPWAADWYVHKALEQAKAAASPYQNIISAWQHKEKTYLLNTLAQVRTAPPSYRPEDIVAEISDKTRVLIECLQNEKNSSEMEDQDYSGIIFVTRRDAVLALAEVLAHHPQSSKIFRVGCLLGSSDSAYRRSFLDITRKMLTQSQAEVLLDFKVGEKNLIVSTAVAEEGIDIQACGSVIRWDVPQNMTSWAQSRGRARRQRSTFILMFCESGFHDGLILKWELLEKEMQAKYNDSRKRPSLYDDNSMSSEDEEDLELYVESTGALLTLDSAVAHLNHFCSVLPNASHLMHTPIYDIDPPDVPEGWHSLEHPVNPLPYQGPWGSTVTLPKLVPAHLRIYSTDRVYPTKRSAHRHVAFKAYRALYESGLLNDHLLPLTSVIEPDLEEEVKALLEDVGKRSGTASVTSQMDPWAPADSSHSWWCSELHIDGLPPLYMITRNQIIELTDGECPTLYRPGHHPIKVGIRPAAMVELSGKQIIKAQEFTRQILWQIYGTRMSWDDLHFAYLFLPVNDVDESPEWVTRLSWLDDLNASTGRSDREAFYANAEAFGERFSFPNDLTMVQDRGQAVKNFKFLRWRFEPVSPDEEQVLRERYSFSADDRIIPPFLVVQRFPRRMNFLTAKDAEKSIVQDGKHSTEIELLLRARFSTVSLISAVDVEYAFLLPSIIRYLSTAMTVSSLRTTLLTPSLASITMKFLRAAITAPVSQEHINYQRLETLGDTVLKFVVGVQLLSEYPLWHEGYLTKKKDHSVSNFRLAKDAHAKGLYRWIIRDRFLAQKWKPHYLPADDIKIEGTSNNSESVEKNPDDRQQLSTKMLADVVEALIGAAYLHGSFDLGIECAQLFGLGLVWEKLPLRVEKILSRVETTNDFPIQTTDVERMLEYDFSRKLLLVEALTHASYQFDDRTVSYERMEFLGDSVLDMVVTDYLYHAPGKEYSPGHMHLRKSAVVNTHFLAYICLRSSLPVDTSMPRPNENGGISIQSDSQSVYLWQCLLHSSPRILDDFNNTFFRYQKSRDEIEAALTQETIFPWAALTRLQAPKLYSDMIESLLGAIYLDSNGDLEVVRKVLRKLGILPILERIVEDDVDILHPVSRLSVWAAKKAMNIEYKFKKDEDNITCIILLDGKEEYWVTDTYRGHASQNDVKFAAAEQAIKALHLRELEEEAQIEDEE